MIQKNLENLSGKRGWIFVPKQNYPNLMLIALRGKNCLNGKRKLIVALARPSQATFWELAINMTEDEIDKMPAGKGMDALVAEHVIGWKNLEWREYKHEYYGFKGWNQPISGTSPEGWYGNGPNHETFLTRKYSTDWKDMRDVVDQFRFGKHKQGNGKDSVACVIEMVVSDWDFGEGDCECKIYSPSLAPVIGSGNQMPLAMCRAALKVAFLS